MLVTQQYRVEGPVMLFLTTTAIDVDEELVNRCLVLTINESREQTRAIQQRQRARRTLAGLIAQSEAEAVQAASPECAAAAAAVGGGEPLRGVAHLPG